jgi:choline dehydrogenase-like flavoprotein
MAPAEYDFIIVGGGTSGLVVANRLTEDSNVRVLVVEAGSNQTEDPRVKIPAMYDALKGTELDWSFESEVQVRSILICIDTD